jgi:hypothetical protein
MTGQKHSEETKAKISAANMGHEVSPEARAKMSESHKKLTLTPEHRAKIGAARRGRKISEEERQKRMGRAPTKGATGYKHSAEAKAKIIESNKRRKIQKSSVPFVWPTGEKLLVP